MAKKIQQRAIDTRNRILVAARELFSERGYNGSAVDEIAARAKANKQRIYAYFGSKQQLFEAVLLTLFNEVNLFAHTDMDDCPPAELTGRVLHGFMKIHAQHPEFWRLLAWVNLDSGVQVARLLDARSHENTAIRGLFEQGVSSGVIREMEFLEYIYALLALSWFYYSNARTLPVTLSPKLYEEEYKERLIADMAKLFVP